MESEGLPAIEKEVSFTGSLQNNTKQGEEQSEVARRAPWCPLSSSRESFLITTLSALLWVLELRSEIGNSPAT